MPIEDSAAPIRGEDGSVAGVVMVFRDVTEARRASAARRHLAAIVNSSDVAIISKSLDGTILSWNAAERLYGYAAEEVVGKPLSLLVPPDHPDELPAIMERLRRGERIEHFHTERLCKDGTRVAVSLTISPIRDSEGQIVDASKIARDISTAKRHEVELRFLAGASAALAELLDVRSTLQKVAALGVPHFADWCAVDLSGPGGLERIAVAHANPAVGRARAMIDRQAGQLTRLVDELLDASRIERGKVRLTVWPLDLAALVRTAVGDHRHQADAAGLSVELAVPPAPVQVEGDAARLTQVVTNLWANAVKFTPKGGRLSVRLGVEGGEVVLSVSDTGVGIEPAAIPTLFQAFRQVDADPARTKGGLGLAVVRGLVELHGGQVEAASEGTGRGATFTVRLPLGAEQPAPAAGVPPPEATPPGGGL